MDEVSLSWGRNVLILWLKGPAGPKRPKILRPNLFFFGTEKAIGPKLRDYALRSNFDQRSEVEATLAASHVTRRMFAA